MMSVQTIARFHFLTQDGADLPHADLAAKACQGGVTWVQLRVKDHSAASWLAIARHTLQVCRDHGARLIINDNWQIAAEVGADGVHLGKTDGDPAQARQALGADALVGGTANTFDDICSQVQAGVDYLGVGPFRYTETKKNLSPVLGAEGLANLQQQCLKSGIVTPLIAIGGIKLDDLATLTATGIHGWAVSSAVGLAAKPKAAAGLFVNATKGWGDEALADSR